MTDNEIIKALDCLCGHTLGDCDKCPLYKHIDHDCVPDVIEPALSLIQRQQAEIERLEKLTEKLLIDFNGLSGVIKRAKAEAIKEFAERLKKDLCYEDFFETNVVFLDESKIDNLVKEMVGE